MSRVQEREFDPFPVPSRPPSILSPARLPGSTLASTQTLRDVLKDNHSRWHIFFDDFPRHNHITHHLIAIWAMGADKDLIQKSYEHDIQLQRPIGTSPEAITRENVFDHLGNALFYKAYLDFFECFIRDHSPAKAMEDFVFSNKANFGSKNKDGKHPEMMCRMMASLGHGLIHLGYGAEFGLPGMFAEGLAQAAVSNWPASPLHPPSLFQDDSPNDPVSKGTHAFDIIARVLDDSRFDTKGSKVFEMWNGAVNLADDIYALVKEWMPENITPESVEKKIEELTWAATLLYAVSGFKADGQVEEYNADFISAHFVTAVIFLPSLMPFLTPRSQGILLRSSFSMYLTWWIALGRPKLDLKAFFTAPIPTTPHPAVASTNPSLSLATSSAANPNPWLPLIHQGLVHPDDHVPKLIRALVHFDVAYGSTSASAFKERKLELEGAEYIDGTLFLRAAALTMSKLGTFELDRDEEAKGGYKVPPLLVYGWDFKTFREGLGDIF